ncbi:CRISPR-associated protein TM1802 [Acididesulfobacillus acetoxydans]|uniref:CRISPR-associated protein TM1802 n=1 Tax=Acididesulfobacillus acetoxydans TaxID=1561005 RepID=A0A8S0Y048_9FIRM|nr:TM1802 family CRISPR-associated protein [Acididesulfobacillus acetoxydans]CAA7602827.1 CRISPR-associated protein TM1802 [Acididesulfobacillus acetoxydans]CEJ05708.1 CRISPR-associated protein TM1802 [Acididesulfobacillus acetoxydans]
MIASMRALALDYLIEQLGGGTLSEGASASDVEAWYRSIRTTSPGKLFSYLVEDSGRVDKVYILEAESGDTVRLSVQEVVAEGTRPGGGCPSHKLPFMKPSGNMSPAVGPVIKRTYAKEKGGGPSENVLNNTLKYFREVAQAQKPWSAYFAEILNLLARPQIRLTDGTLVNWKEEGYSSLLACAVDRIGPEKNTVFLTVRDAAGKLPGEKEIYTDYLLLEKLAGDRYVTGSSPAQEGARCPLCGQENVTVFPNGLKGAGVNLLNTDRAGVFPGIDPLAAWKGYALCAACADLLYVFKFHVLKKGGADKKRQPFGARVAGDSALVIPEFFPGIPLDMRLSCIHDVQQYVEKFKGDVEAEEEGLLDRLKDEQGILNLTILWADVGQNIENVSGIITQILPSRLRYLSAFNAQTRAWTSPLFPGKFLANGSLNFKPQLALSALNSLFLRPGGNKTKDLNSSKRLAQLKRLLAAAIYHGTPIGEKRFWDEVLITARCYLAEAVENKDGYRSLLYEFVSKNGKEISAAAWVKHVHWYLRYFSSEGVGVLPMTRERFQPAMESLKPYFGEESGIDTPEKAFAFLLGVLYGKLLQVQGAKGVNVGANALTWLKRLTLKGKDLPELYVKTREKLLAYEAEKSAEIRMLIQELGQLGISLGDHVQLDEVKTNYFLLLGQSMTENILPSKAKEQEAQK